MADQEGDETQDLQVDGPSFVAAITPILIASSTFLTALANSPAFIAALSASSGFKKAVQTQAGQVVGSTITQGLTR
jgi:hypothetical protein